MINESVFKYGSFVELQNREIEIISGGINPSSIITVGKWVLKAIEIIGIIDACREFGRGFYDGWKEATR